MKKQLEQVLEFHKAFGIPVLKEWESPNQERIKLRKKLILEEFSELKEAHESGDTEHIAKEACDLVYVCLGAIHEFGWRDSWTISMISLDFGEDVIEMADVSEIETSVNQFVQNGTFGSRQHTLDLILISIDDYLQGMKLSPYFIQCFDEVHRSNMSKLDANGKPVYREDGKVLKSEIYSPADLSFLQNHFKELA
jgi:predicted HAD superfamily Cof-like phosphohydrolase